MRVLVVGATGNVGTSTIAALKAEPGVDEIAGLARRLPDEHESAAVQWIEADITTDDLVSRFRGFDVVVHLAWAIQPSRDEATLARINVEGSRRVFSAAGEAGVPALVYASSIGAYSPGPKDRPVDESWPTGGIETSFYSRHKAAVERLLDDFEREHPDVRVARLRPGLIFKRESASEIRRYFAGPFLPGSLLRRQLIPVLPRIRRLVFQAVHADDIGRAYASATAGDARGAFNVAADPVIGPEELAELFGARLVPFPERAARAAATATWKLRLQPTPAGWFDMALGVPVMDTTRARTELGWTPRVSSLDALRELLAGLREGAGGETPPLDPDAGGPARLGEIGTGVGARQ